MALTLHYHPLSSFCHKVLIALYENGTPFEGRIVDFGDPASRDPFLELWPLGKIPVLRDEARDETIPETTIMIEYIDRHYPGRTPLFPREEKAELQARLWDRFFDLYVNVPMQKVVGDRIRGDAEKDPKGVADAESTLKVAYDLIERQMVNKTWALGEDFSVADCAAMPALFYAHTLLPFGESHPNVAAYFERILGRPSVKRTLEEAKPYFKFYPYRERLPARFLE